MISIAEKKYGDGSLYTLIVKANNLADHGRLKIGQKLALPPNYEHLREQIERTVTPLPPTR